MSVNISKAITSPGDASSSIKPPIKAPTKGPKVGARLVTATTTDISTEYGICIKVIKMKFAIPTIRASSKSSIMNLLTMTLQRPRNFLITTHRSGRSVSPISLSIPQSSILLLSRK